MNNHPNSPVDAPDADRGDVAHVLGGDLGAFANIVQRWQGPLVNMAWRYCRDRSRAEEMAQEAFVRAWKGLPQWRGDCAFSTWLFSVAANVYRSELKRFPTSTVPVEDVAEPSVGPGQHTDLMQQNRREAVRRAVLALPPRYREPLVLFYFHEMDVGAAARTLGMPVGTLKARLSRGRELLRKRFPQLKDQPTDAAMENLRGREA